MKTESNKPKVLVFEPYAQGHRLNYARIVIDAVHPLAGTVIFCTQESTLHSQEFATHFAQLPNGVEVEAFPVAVGASIRKKYIHFARTYQAAIERHRPDFIYVPTADGLIQSIGWFRLLTGNWRKSPEAEMLVMRGHNYLGSNGGWYNALKRWFAITGIKASGCTRLHALDKQLYELLKNCRFSNIELNEIPEARTASDFPCKIQARKELGILEDDLVVGFFGRRDTRKGFDLLLHAFSKLSHPNAKLLILGQKDRSTTDLYASIAQGGIQHRIISRDAYVTTQELLTGMAAADVICIPYPAHQGSSGFLADAAASKNMILATKNGWIGRTVTRYELGKVCEVRDIASFHLALEQALSECRVFRHSELARSFLSETCRENVKAHWARHLTARLGQSPA